MGSRGFLADRPVDSARRLYYKLTLADFARERSSGRIHLFLALFSPMIKDGGYKNVTRLLALLLLIVSFEKWEVWGPLTYASHDESSEHYPGRQGRYLSTCVCFCGYLVESTHEGPEQSDGMGWGGGEEFDHR